MIAPTTQDNLGNRHHLQDPLPFFELPAFSFALCTPTVRPYSRRAEGAARPGTPHVRGASDRSLTHRVRTQPISQVQPTGLEPAYTKAL